jgi:hypothetical protein
MKDQVRSGKSGEMCGNVVVKETAGEEHMDDREKMPIIIKHWIEHNESHIEEYRQWAEKAGEMGLDGIKSRITEAIDEIIRSNSSLEEALKEL